MRYITQALCVNAPYELTLAITFTYLFRPGQLINSKFSVSTLYFSVYVSLFLYQLQCFFYFLYPCVAAFYANLTQYNRTVVKIRLLSY